MQPFKTPPIHWQLPQFHPTTDLNVEFTFSSLPYAMPL